VEGVVLVAVEEPEVHPGLVDKEEPAEAVGAVAACLVVAVT
jgi:hypothetical protein